MARITVEDCIDKFPSRFELVLIASNRARKLHSGETPTVDKDNDKNTVIALREIAEQSLSNEKLKNDLIEEYQTVSLTEDEELIENDEVETENPELEIKENDTDKEDGEIEETPPSQIEDENTLSEEKADVDNNNELNNADELINNQE